MLLHHAAVSTPRPLAGHEAHEDPTASRRRSSCITPLTSTHSASPRPHSHQSGAARQQPGRGAGLEIRLNGTNQTPSEHIKLGAHHTLEVELHRPFTITKDCWDKLDLLRVRQATNPAATADLAVLLIAVRLAAWGMLYSNKIYL